MIHPLSPVKFDAPAFLLGTNPVIRRVQRQPGEIIFSQGDSADFVFYIQFGRLKLTARSAAGKEATIMPLSAGDFAGEEALAMPLVPHTTTATVISTCTAFQIGRKVMIRAMHDSQPFSDLFLAFLLRRNEQIQADLIDHLFNCSEKRLARTLLLMAESCDIPEAPLPPVTQETLAEMVGTTRSRVNFFMNRFRKLGLIEYRGRICVNKEKLRRALHE